MMAAIIPLPPGATEPCVAPAPSVLCAACGGLAPDLDCEAPCADCNGCGVNPIGFRLPATRSYESRRVWYEPACGRLTVKIATRPHHREAVARYEVHEIETDWPGRGFVLAKEGHPDRVHQAYLGPDAATCSCEAETYQTSAKANQRAHDAGEETFPTMGCVHLDSLAALMAAGWFDLNIVALPEVT